jgi:hypothetical protein
LTPGLALAKAADVALTATISPVGVLTPGSDAVVVVTMSNAGPQAAPLIAVGTSYPATAGFRTFSLYPIAGTAPCTMFFDEFFSPETGMGTVFVNIFSPSNVPAGSSVRCEIGLRVAGEAPPQTVVRFGTLVSGAADPNAGNNDALIILQTLPISVPSGSFPSMLTLTALLLLASSLHIRRTRRSS